MSNLFVEMLGQEVNAELALTGFGPQFGRIRVQDIACCSEWWEWQPDRIATEYGLSLAQVHAALSYYFDNIEEIRSGLQEELEAYQHDKAEKPSLLAQKLGARTQHKSA